MTSNGLTITASDGSGSFGGYLKAPASGSGPGIVVFQEIFGVNQVMRDIVDWLAENGYVAFCPDLFWRIEPGIQITDQTQEEWNRAFELFQAFDVDAGVRDIAASIAAVRGHGACTGKVGGVGYCLGGKLAYLAATRTDIDAAVGYYGVGIEDMLDEATNISKPLMLHIAEEDQFCSKEAQEKIKTGLADNPHVTIHSYPGNDHAFARVGGAHYDADAANLANQRTLAAFQASLS